MLKNHLVRPFSAATDITSRGYSLTLQRRIADFGADDSFGKVPWKLKEHYGIHIPLHSPRTITEKHAGIIKEMETVTDILPQHGHEYIISETDGSLIPIVTIAERITAEDPSDGRKRRTVGWKEARLSLAHQLGNVTPIFEATMGNPDTTGDQMLNCAILAGAGENSKIHGVGDGAPWIAAQGSRVFSEQGTYLVDFMHLSGYLSAASGSCCPHDSNNWLARQKQLMKENEVQAVIKALEPYIEAPSIVDANAPVRACHRYMINRLNQFNYKDALEANLPIGSGEIESAHRYVIQKRLKLAGAWWEKTNAQNMLALRVLRANGGWDDYWAQDSKLAA